MKKPAILSDADTRRHAIVDSALKVFATSGYASTPVTAIAAEAGISQAYVFKLYGTKEALFVAALELCFDRIEAALDDAADAAADQSPDVVLDAMGQGYARLIANRNILMVQVHAQSAADVPAIRAAMQRGLARIVTFTKTRTGASDTALQRFIAFGQLCHLVTTMGLVDLDTDWARTVVGSLRHYDEA